MLCAAPLPLANQKTLCIMTLRAILINNLDLIMNTREILILKALQFKQMYQQGHSLDSGDLVDRLLDSDPAKADELTKNVCARIPLELAKDMEAIGGLLNLNKREIITLALNDFLDKAKATLEEFEALPEEGI